MAHIAVEGRCFVLSACQYLPGPSPRRSIRGGSVILDPYGKALAGPTYGEEAILFADLDLHSLRGARFDLDVTGHYARPDIFELRLDKRPKSPVVFDGQDPHGE